MITLFSFFSATCFTITVFAVPFYALGASAETAFRIVAFGEYSVRMRYWQTFAAAKRIRTVRLARSFIRKVVKQY